MFNYIRNNTTSDRVGLIIIFNLTVKTNNKVYTIIDNLITREIAKHTSLFTEQLNQRKVLCLFIALLKRTKVFHVYYALQYFKVEKVVLSKSRDNDF